jgi:hypothetical protein
MTDELVEAHGLQNERATRLLGPLSCADRLA